MRSSRSRQPNPLTPFPVKEGGTENDFKSFPGGRRKVDPETRNRYRLRCAKLSEVLPRSERSLATVRMTDFGWGDSKPAPDGRICADAICADMI